MTQHLPILQVVLPLLAAPLCLLINSRNVAWMLAALAALGSFACAALLLGQVAGGDEISYALGGWAAPFGIEYRVDAVNAILLVLVSGAAAVMLLLGRASARLEIAPEAEPLFYCMFSLNIAGLMGMAVTNDIFNLFVFLEISSLSTYALVSLGRGRKALTAAFRYLVIGTVGATFYVIGVGLLYMMTGSLNITDLAGRLPAVEDSSTVRTALAFMVVGIGVKLGMMPLHFWLPDAYTRAPSLVSAFVAATATKVAIYVMLRIVFTLFGTDLFLGTGLAAIVFALGLVAMFLASLTAIFQTEAKRMLAWSSLAQVGYILAGLSLCTVQGVSAAILHVFNHGLMKAALFMALAGVAARIGSTRIADMAGLGRTMPLTMAAFVIGGLSLIGLPLTVGLISKWYLIAAALALDYWWLALLILASSGLAVIYIWRVVETAYFREPPAGRAEVREAPASLLAAIWLLVTANVWFGVHAEMTGALATQAARFLLGGAS
ncbi:MAG: monovalent cation/H+ antiporter subunit D family protein [Alphaproteobacteria bacterium]